jgi:hypothetical protein
MCELVIELKRTLADVCGCPIRGLQNRLQALQIEAWVSRVIY